MVAVAHRRLELRPLPTDLVLVAGAAVVVAATIAAMATGSLLLLLSGVGLLALAGMAYVCVWVSPATFASLGVAATVFSRHTGDIGIPFPPDRLLLLCMVASLVLGLPGAARRRQILWRPLHAVLGLLVAVATVSAIASGTLGRDDAVFGLLDRLGVVPFLMFVLAPLVFGTERDRNTLLTVLVVLGGYLGTVTLFEAIGADALVFPRYITDPGVGIHFGRARGPFTEAVANGLGLFGCAVACMVAYVTWSRVLHRRLALAIGVLCLVGTLFTLTRAVWLATVVASLLALLANYRTRAMLAPIGLIVVVVLGLAITTVPGFQERMEERSSSERPLWDRYNTNRAALAMFKDEPLFGVGWQRYRDESRNYMRTADGYPLTGTQIEVHNVLLSHAAEIGLVGAALWLLAMLFGVGGAITRPGPASLDPWRLGTFALLVHWVLVAAFGPLSYAFPNLLLWTWAGIAAIGHTSVERPDDAVPVGASA